MSIRILPEFFIPFLIPLPLIIFLYKMKIIDPTRQAKIPMLKNLNFLEISWIFGLILSFSFLIIDLLDSITRFSSDSIIVTTPLIFTFSYILALDRVKSDMDIDMMTEVFIITSWIMGIIPLRQNSASAVVVQFMLYPLIQIFMVLVLYIIFKDQFGQKPDPEIKNQN